MNKKTATSLFLFLLGTFAFAQTKERPWNFEVGVNAVDVYPVGENTPQGDYFDEFFNWTDHWNLGIPTVKVSRYLADNLSLGARVSYNKLTKWGETASQPSAAVNKLEYYGIDGALNYSLASLFNTQKFEPFVGVGGGYTWIKEGMYNTNNAGGNNFVGAGTVNGSAGVKYWVADNIAFSFESTYKHAFKDYLAKHWQHNLGVVFKLGKSQKQEEATEVVDTDGDGVPDTYDLCPDVAGPKQFGGCPDSDGDGVPDNIDKCPNVKGDNGNGCPTPKNEYVPETTPVAATVKVPTNKTIYFDFASTSISNNAKEILDDLVSVIKSSKANSYNIKVEGHTDNIGSNGFNQKLSVKRADSIKDYLVSQGISSSAINTTGLGEENPASNNNTDAGRALNRRGELTIKVSF